MKRKTTNGKTNGKKLAAGDKQEVVAITKELERYVLGDKSKDVVRGFYKQLIDFVGKKNGTGVTLAMVVEEFSSKKISAVKCKRFIQFALRHGALKVKNGGSK